MSINEKRSLRAERTLDFYATVEACDSKSSLINLLADIRHYCNNDGLSFDYFSKMSMKRFDVETLDEYVEEP